MGFFKNIIAASRQPVRSAGGGEGFAVNAQSASDLAAAGMPGDGTVSSTIAADDMGTDGAVIQRAVNRSGAPRQVQRGAGPASKHQADVSPAVRSMNRAPNPVTPSRVSHPAEPAPGNTVPREAGLERFQTTPSTSPDVESIDPGQTVNARVPVNPSPKTADAAAVSAAAVSLDPPVASAGGRNVVQSRDVDVGGHGREVSPMSQGAGENVTNTVAAAVVRRKATTDHRAPSHLTPTAQVAPARGLATEPSSAVVADASDGAGKVYSATDVAPGPQFTPGGQSPSAAVASGGGAPQTHGHPGALQTPLSATDGVTETRPASPPQSTQVHQAEVKQHGANTRTVDNVPALSTRVIESAVEKGRQAAAPSVVRPPQVRIGQVNVIVEAPAAPQRQPQSAETDHSSSWSFLRSL